MRAKADWENASNVIRSHVHRAFEELAAITEDQPATPGQPDDDLIAWLSELCLLSHVPFHYLIPSDSLLPHNSLRLFYVNPNWQRALVDGAASLGRTATVDLSHDEALLDAVFAQIGKRMKAVRPLLQKKAVAAEELREGVQVIGGFMLRSPLVRGWRGLEFQALSAKGTQLQALRIELLSEEVLIGLFDGVPYTLQIAQPPEGFHFGFDHINDRYSKRLRSFETGELLSESETVEVAVHNKKLRTIDVTQTAKNMENYFKRPITSAEFALQMIKTPYMGLVSRVDAD